MIGIATAQRAISGLSSVRENGQGRLFFIRMKQEGYYLLLALPVLLLLIFFFIVPLFDVLRSSFGTNGEWTLRHYEAAIDLDFRGVDYLSIWRTTIQLSVVTTVGCIVLGYPVAYYLATSSGRARAIVLVMVIIPFITNLIAQTYAWRVILGRRGPVNDALQAIEVIGEPLELLFNRFSVNVGMVHIFLPFMILPMYAVMRGIPQSLPSIAEGLGASPFQSFKRVFLPMSMPGVFAGAMLVLILSAGYTIG
ncbi:MAG: ABC transporter permease, partial [Dehalococcoidia bacterium]